MSHPDSASILSALWRASWQAGCLCLLVLALRWTLRDRLPAAWRCRLWGLVFLRLVLPAVPASPLSLFNWVPADPLPADVWPTLTVVVTSPTNAPPEAVDTPPPPPPPRPAPSRMPELLLATWLAGGAALLLATTGAHARFARRVRRSAAAAPAHLSDAWNERPPLLVTDAVTSPALFGVVRGRLLLPPDLSARLSPEELSMVFRHERAHVRRHDLAVGWLTVLIRCVYWFHPLVWVAVATRRADAEGACDDAALAGAPADDRWAYGRALLAVAGGRRVPAVGIADGRTDLRRRLARVAAGRRAGWWSTAIAAGLTAAVGCAALTGSDRPANVTRTYAGAVPPSSDPNPFTATTPPFGSLSMTGAEEPPPLVAVIRQTITPDAWGHHGVDVHADGTAVVVTAPPDTQAQVERLIEQGRAIVQVQVRVFTLRPSQVRAAGLVVPPVDVVGPITGDAIGDLLRIAKQNPAATVLTAPRITMFNGQKTVLIDETQQAYVSDQRPVIGRNTPRFDPTTSKTVAAGVVAQVQPVVTPDHRAVDLTANVQMARLLSLDPVEVTARSPGGATTRATYQVPHSLWVGVQSGGVRVKSGESVWVRGRSFEVRGGSKQPSASLFPPLPTPPPSAAYRPADPDAAETFVVWTVTVVGRGPATRPATPATTGTLPPRVGGPLPVDLGAPMSVGQRKMLAVLPADRLSPGLGNPAAATAEPPGTPTPDGRGVAMRIPVDVRGATVLVDGRSPAADAARQMVVGRGGRLADRVSVDTDYVVTDARPIDAAVRQAAETLHIPVVTPAQLQPTPAPVH